MEMTEFKVEIGDELNRIIEDPKEKTIQLLLLMKKNPKDYWIDPEIIDRLIEDLKF